MYERFVSLLEEKKLKPADVTKATGIKSTVFSEWKKGKSSPNADKLLKIARYLNTTVEYLMTGEEPHTASGSFPLSEQEKRLVVAYRKADEIDQTSVRRTLGIDYADSVKKGELA